MKSHIIVCALLTFAICSLTSCKTYYIPVDSFKAQFVGMKKTKEVMTRGPLGRISKYMTYPINIVNCVDKNGAPYHLKASPSLEMRFTYGLKKKRATFYFDQIAIHDSLITGGESRIISSIEKTIPLNQISKIEIQDGRKKYTYIQ